VNVSTQLAEPARGIQSGELVATPTNLGNALMRLSGEANALEVSLDAASTKATSEYVERAVTKARWVLSDTSSTLASKDLAEAVLVLAGCVESA
jgi:hypothetical protein